MDTVKVEGVACPCPGTPHPEGDTVELRARVGLAGGAQLQTLIVRANADGMDTAELTGKLVEGYLLVGVCGWSFVDDKGKPIPVTPDTIRSLLLDDFERASPVAEKADSLYEGPILGPLVNGAASSSRSTRTRGSTSQKAPGSRKSPRRSKPSLTSTTPTVVTATTTS